MTQSDNDETVGDVAMDESIEDASAIPDDALRTYYEHSIDVWEQMSAIGQSEVYYESLIVPGTASNGARAWYRNDDRHVDVDAVDADDVDKVTAGRPWSVSADREQIVDELLQWDYRLPHLSINYQLRTADEWTTKADGDWVSGKPLPDYNDFDALTLFADVDFDADSKERPVDPDTRAQIELLLGRWRSAYASAVGDDRDAVRMLDSVGGTYIFLRPAVTAPICEYAQREFDATGQQLLMDEVCDRWREFNKQVQSSIDEGSDWDAFGLDGNTNKNRLFKAPLAVHKSLPGVVTPIDVDDISFEFTHVSDVDADLIDQVESWAESFTARDDSVTADWAGELLASLFDAVDADNWRSDIGDWVTERQTADAAGHHRAAVRTDTDDIDIDIQELTGDVSLVSSKDAVWNTIDNLDCEKVAQALGCISRSERQDADDVTRIDVTWRKSESDDSAMVNDEQFTDMDGMEGIGGAADLVAYNLLGSDQTAPTDWRSNSNHIETVLRWFWNSGFEVPVYVPERGSDRGNGRRYRQTPNWAIRRVAELLDIAPAVAFDDETDECRVASLFNRILDALEQVDINHGRERKQVRVDAAGDSVDATDLDIDVDAIIDDSPVDIDTDTAADDVDTSADADTTASTWTERFDIKQRDNVTKSGTSYHTAVPGVDLQWIELDSGRAGWGWTEIRTADDGSERVEYDIVINADIELVSRLEFTEQRHKNTQWKLQVNPTLEGESARTVTLTPAAFNGSRELREELIGQCESVVFNTHGKGMKAVNELKQFVHSQTAPRRIAHDKIELVDETEDPVFVTPAGTIGADGWIDGAEHTYHGVADGVEGDWRADPETIDPVDDDLVRQVCELLPRVRDDREQWLSMIGYAFASSFRPILFNQPASRVDTWNLLHVSGKSGAGKSAVAKTLSGALGMNMKSTTGAEKTSHAQEHMFSATNGMPVAMDEYNPVNWANWKTTAFHEHLKKSTDAQSIEKGNPDQSLTEYRFEVSPIVLGEQTLPDSMPALPRRAVEVSLSTTATKANSKTATLFNDLRGLKDDDYQSGLHHHAVAWWSHVCADGDDALELVTRWHETMDWIEAELQRRDIDINTELEREMHQQGLQTVTFGLHRWREFAIDQGADPDVLFTDADIVDTLEYLIKQKTGEQAASINNEDTLLELFADAAAIRDDGGEYSTAGQQYVEYGDHYRIVHAESSEPTELRFHLKSSIPQISKYIRDYDINTDLYEKSDYYRWFKSSSDDPDTPIAGVQQRTTLNGSRRRCVNIRFEELIDNLDIHPDDIIPDWADVFYDEDLSDDDDTDGDAASDDQSSTVNMGSYNVDALEEIPLSDIDPDPDDQAIVSTTAGIEVGEYDHVVPDGDGPDVKVTLADGDGTEVKLIAWNAADIELPIDNTGRLTCEKVTVRGAKPDHSEYEDGLQLKATEQTQVTPATDPGQQSMQSIGADSDDPSDNEQPSMADGGTTDDFDTPDQSTRIERIQHILEDTDSPLTQEQLVSKTDWSAAVIDATLEPLLKRQAVMQIEDGYVLI